MDTATSRILWRGHSRVNTHLTKNITFQISKSTTVTTIKRTLV
uniref:Uncharacterized protein n=1 Tax=Anguilla anguilla TaxID=7936 RepID=A0A0E9WVY5_ANGAN